MKNITLSVILLTISLYGLPQRIIPEGNMSVDECNPYQIKPKHKWFPLGTLPVTTGWKISSIHSDEFTTLDPSKWEILDSNCHEMSPKAYFKNSRDNIRVENGLLILQMKREPTSFFCENNYYDYSSGAMKAKTSFRYGYVEIQTYLPYESAFNPCFWMVGDRWTNPVIYDEYDEIDVFERSLREPEKSNLLEHNIHHNLNINNSSSLMNSYIYRTSPLGLTTTYAVEWLPEEIHFYINGYLTCSARYTQEISWTDETSEYACQDFDNALGQRFIVSLSGNKLLNDLSNFSETMKVDYIRAYKLEKGFDYEFYPESFNPSDRDLFKVHQSIRLGGEDHTAVVNPGNNMTLWATDSIIMEKGFTVNRDALLTIRVIKTQPSVFINSTHGGSIE